MRSPEGEAERLAYIIKRTNDADMATREYVNKHAYDIGYAEGLAKVLIRRIHLAQRALGRPLTAVDDLDWLPLSELEYFLDQLEQQALSSNDAP